MALVGDGREQLQTKLSNTNNSHQERYRAAMTVAMLALSCDGDAHEECQLILEACGLLDPVLAPAAQ